MKIFTLSELPESYFEAAGGKAKGLARLIRAGLNVPEGFVIIEAKTEKDFEEAAEFYLRSGLSAVAVRSSATSEDGVDFSNAGQYSTYLNIDGKESFIAALKGCLESLDSVTAKSYSAFFGNLENKNMSIVVQKMVPAACAGVAFSRDPVTGGDAVIIEAVRGLGEALVSGHAAAEKYTFSKGGYAERDNAILPESRVFDIAKEISDAETAFGIPLDTEWAIGGDGELYWLQARPITAANESSLDELDGRSDSESIFSNCNIGEMLPGAVTPLSLSTSVRAIDYGLRKMLVMSGTQKSLDAIPETSCVTHFNNHLFFNLSTVFEMEGAVLGAERKMIIAGICGRALEVPETKIKKRNIFTRMINGVKYFRFILSGNKARKQVNKLADSFSIPMSGDMHADYETINKALDVLNMSLLLHYRTSSQSGAMSTALIEILKSKYECPEEVYEKLAGLLEDIDGIESVDILRSMRKLSKAILNKHPEAASWDWQRLDTYLSVCDGEVREAYAGFLNRHGHRAIREAEMRSKAWRNDNRALAEYLLTIMGSGAVEEAEKTQTAETNIAEFLKTQKGLFKPLIKYVINQARKGVANREFSKARFIKIIDNFKVAYDCLAESLVKAGALPDKDLIFFLTHKELRELIFDKKAALIKKAVARRNMLPEQQQFKYHNMYVGKPVPVADDFEKAETGSVLTGASISRGRVKGRARVVKSVDDAKKLEKGEIMVASFTDIGWSPYYCLIGGLITEVGSVLSHGAVVAREYALPLVVNIANVTSLIKTGDYIDLNASSGTVTVL